MQYDFETILDRRGRDALALDVIPYAGVEPKVGFSRIPMWVADMSFPTAPLWSRRPPPYSTSTLHSNPTTK